MSHGDGELTATAWIRAHTELRPVPFVREISLYQADEPVALWEETERRAGHAGLPPPFWAFAWAGGQALARYLLDHREVVTGRRVLDLATGSGLVAIAAAMAGAAAVRAADIDELAVAAAGLNVAANGVMVRAEVADALAGAADADLVVAGDVCYDSDMTARVIGFLDRAGGGGAEVLLGDPGRSYLPRSRLVAVAAYDLPVSYELEGVRTRRATVWRLVGTSTANTTTLLR